MKNSCKLSTRSFFILLVYFIVLLPGFSRGSNGNPKECVANHLKYTNSSDYKPKMAAKSFYGENSNKSIDLANKLKLTYDGMGLFIQTDRITDNPDYIDSTSGKHKYFISPDRLGDIYVEKIGNYWYYSPECYDDIEELYNIVYPLGADLLYENIPKFENRKFLGIYAWQYLSMLVVLILAFLAYFILKLVFRPLIAIIAEKSFNLHIELPVKYKKTAKIASLLFIFYFLKFALALIRFPIRFSAFLIVTIDIVIALLIGIFIYRIFDIVMSFVKVHTDATPSKMDDQYLPIIRQIAKLLIGTAIIFKVLVLLNVNVTALIAGLSIGGLALALASQDTVKNFIGSVMIFMDKPFKVDDWIEVDKYSGTVREVGFRSTRIEQMDTSIISIPNNVMSNQALVNKGERHLRMYQTTITLEYGTPAKKLELYIQGLRKIATDHPMIFGKYHIYLSELGSSSINILFRIFFTTMQYDEELKLREQITFLLIELAEHIGVNFAFPSQTLYINNPDIENNSAVQITEEKLEDFFKNRNIGKEYEEIPEE